MTKKLCASTLAALAFFAAPTSAVPALPDPPQVIVSAHWLLAHRSDPNLVIIYVDMPSMGDTPDPFSAGHIPGARFLEYHSIATMGGDGELSSELVPADSLKSVLESLGVSDKSHIVVYASSKSPVLMTRTFFTLDYLGLGDRISALDGGLDAWKAAGGKLETGAPKTYPRGTLHTTPHREVLADGAWLLHHLSDPNVNIIDARAPEFYTGAKRGHAGTALGHIPGAHNLYFATLIDANGFFKSDAEARALFANAGASNDKPLVVYCHIGQTATVVYFEARRLGIPVKLYDGSWEDWSLHSKYPVARGASPQ